MGVTEIALLVETEKHNSSANDDEKKTGDLCRVTPKFTHFKTAMA